MLSICLSSTYRPNGQNSNTKEMFQTKHTQQRQPAKKKTSTQRWLHCEFTCVLSCLSSQLHLVRLTQHKDSYSLFSFFPDSFCWCLIRWVEICVFRFVSFRTQSVLFFRLLVSDIVPWHPPTRRFVGVTHTKTLTTNHSGNSEIPENRFFTLSHTHTCTYKHPYVLSLRI